MIPASVSYGHHSDASILAMGAQPAQSPPAAIGTASGGAPDEANGTARTPLCFVVDSDASIQHFLSPILHGAGIDTEELEGGQTLLPALARRTPDIVFLDVPIESAEAIGCVIALGNNGYRGRVQLMSNRGSAVLAHVKSIGEQQRLQVQPVLRKAIRDQRPGKRLDRILVSAEDRLAQKAAGRRRGVRPRAPSTAWRADARRLGIGSDHALRIRPDSVA